MENEIWIVDYDNDTGPNDEGFSEWWCVTDGEKSFKSYSNDDAQWLCKLLNSLQEAGRLARRER